MLTECLLIGPSSDGSRTLGIDAHQRGQLVREVRPVGQDILLIPGIPVLGSGEKIPFAPVTVGVCQYEVVTQIDWITTLGDEMVYLTIPVYRLVTVKTGSPLQIPQYLPYPPKRLTA